MNSINLKDYKDYQLSMCYNKMVDLRSTCSDNLTEMVSLTVRSEIKLEAKSRGLKFMEDPNHGGIYNLVEVLPNELEQTSIEE